MDSLPPEQTAQKAQALYVALASDRQQSEYRRLIADIRLRRQLDVGKEVVKAETEAPRDEHLAAPDEPDLLTALRPPI